MKFCIPALAVLFATGCGNKTEAHLERFLDTKEKKPEAEKAKPIDAFAVADVGEGLAQAEGADRSGDAALAVAVAAGGGRQCPGQSAT